MRIVSYSILPICIFLLCRVCQPKDRVKHGQTEKSSASGSIHYERQLKSTAESWSYPSQMQTQPRLLERPPFPGRRVYRQIKLQIRKALGVILRIISLMGPFRWRPPSTRCLETLNEFLLFAGNLSRSVIRNLPAVQVLFLYVYLPSWYESDPTFLI